MLETLVKAMRSFYSRPVIGAYVRSYEVRSPEQWRQRPGQEVTMSGAGLNSEME